MALISPTLDNRSYEQLRDELIKRIPVYAPQWTNHNESDPGIALVELFAYLGESLLYRFNQIPDATKIEFLRQQYGLDRSMVERYLLWVVGMTHGDMGFSFEYNLPVADVVGDRMMLSMVLNFATILFVYIVSFPIGVYTATHQYSWGDYGLTFIGFLGLATPNFLLALILLYFANVMFGTAIGGVWREIEGTLAELPSERAAEDTESPLASDELAARRAARRIG